MKRLLAVMAFSALTFIVSAPVLAEDQAPSTPPAATAPSKRQAAFEKRKEIILARLDKRISALQELRSCVSSANNRDDMKQCRDSFREKMRSESGRGRK